MLALSLNEVGQFIQQLELMCRKQNKILHYCFRIAMIGEIKSWNLAIYVFQKEGVQNCL